MTTKKELENILNLKLIGPANFKNIANGYMLEYGEAVEIEAIPDDIEINKFLGESVNKMFGDNVYEFSRVTYDEDGDPAEFEPIAYYIGIL